MTIFPYHRWALIVAIGGFLFGFDATMISGVIGFVTREFGLSDWQIGLVVAAPTLLGIPASLTVSTLADRFGRKRILLLLAILYGVSAVWSALAQDFWALVIARAVGGYAFGSLGLAPIYISEIAPSDSRGRLVSFNQLNIVVGFSIAYFASYAVLQLSQSHAPWVTAVALNTHPWRHMLALEALPAIVWFGLLLRVPESPRWLALQGRTQEAFAVFSRYLQPQEAQKLIEEVRQQEPMRPLLDRIKFVIRPRFHTVLLIGVVLAVAQQITGINAVYFYAATIFQQAGFGTDAAFAQAILIGIVNVVFTVIAMALIDRIGRKPLLMIGMITMTVSMAVIGYGFSQARYELSPGRAAELAGQLKIRDLSSLGGRVFTREVDFRQALRATVTPTEYTARQAEIMQSAIKLKPLLILFGILAFVAGFAVSIGPVMWVMLPEILPNAVRGVGMAMVGSMNSIVSFGVQFLFPIQIGTVGNAATFAAYAAAGAVFTLLIARVVPETRGRTLEQLENDLTRGKQPAK